MRIAELALPDKKMFFRQCKRTITGHMPGKPGERDCSKMARYPGLLPGLIILSVYADILDHLKIE